MHTCIRGPGAVRSKTASALTAPKLDGAIWIMRRMRRTVPRQVHEAPSIPAAEKIFVYARMHALHMKGAQGDEMT